MSSEILSVLEYMEKEKGIPRADMISTITNALKTAAQKGVNSGQELRIVRRAAAEARARPAAAGQPFAPPPARPEPRRSAV